MYPIYSSHILKSLTPSRVVNIVKAELSFVFSMLLKRSVLWGEPYILTVEPTNRCHLKCPQCATGSGKLNRQPGDMDLDTFQKIIDELERSLCYLVLFNQGEPFLNNELFRFIRYAKQKKIYVITSTNGHFLSSKNNAENLVASGVDAIIISLDGADEATYQRYRKGGDFQTVIAGIKNLVAQRKRTPKIYIQFLVMRHNEHQMETIKSLANILKIDKLSFKTVQVENSIDADTFLPTQHKWSRYHFNGKTLQLKSPVLKSCPRLWRSSTILWDGTVVPCCFDKQGAFNLGNIRQQSFQKIWRSSAYEKFRNSFLQKRESFDICANCSQGQKIYL